MSKLGNYIGAVIFGALLGYNGFYTLEKIVSFANTKAVLLQEQISHNPELTEQTYRSVNEAVEKVASGDLYGGLFSAMLTGMTGGMAIYYACRKTD